MSRDTEVKQAIIGMLTLAASLDEGTPDEELHQLLKSVLGQGLFEYRVNLSVSVRSASTADLETLAREAAQQACEQVSQQAIAAVCYAMTLFHALAAECPGVDIQAFLRQRALEIAAEDEGAG